MQPIIFCDFDGVIRHWDNRTLFHTEETLNLPKGVTFQVAFAAENLLPAITGQVPDPIWRENVYAQLAQRYTPERASLLLQAWENSRATINTAIFDLFERRLPSVKIALVTNATSRLTSDMARQAVVDRFDFVINSSEIGVAKPNVDFYAQAANIAAADIGRSIFIDDSAANVQAAEVFGLKGFHFQGIQQLEDELTRWQENRSN